MTCNIIVVRSANGLCYDSCQDIPHSSYGIIFGTGRSAAPSPYYDARVNAAIDLLNAQKIDVLIISGENQYRDYHEVDSMAADILTAVPDAVIYLDSTGTDTYASLKNAAWRFGSDNSYVFISQHFHNQRALFYARLLFSGDVYALDASDSRNFWWRTRNVIREWIARTKAVFVRCFYKPVQSTSVSIMDILHNARYGETHAYSEWHNRYWEVFGEEGKYVFSAMTTRCPDMSLFDSLVSEITCELGNPDKARLYVPMMRDWPEDRLDGFAEWHNDSIRVSLHYNSLDEYTQIEISSLYEQLNVVDRYFWLNDSTSFSFVLGDEWN